MSYAILGNIFFDVLNAPTAYAENHQANFVEHPTIDGKPKLQALGNDLTSLELSISLNYKVGGVESRYQSLLNAKESQKALPLVFGWFNYKGNYVITEISTKTLFTDANGNVLAREMDLRLLEFIGNVQEDPIGSALQTGGSLLGSILPSGTIKNLSSFKSSIEKGVKVYKQAYQTISMVRDALISIKSSDHPLMTAMGILPNVLVNLGGVMSNVEGVLAINTVFNSSSLQDIAVFTSRLNGIYSQFSQMKNVLESRNETNWIEISESHLSTAQELADATAFAVSKMTAWIVIREDENANLS